MPFDSSSSHDSATHSIWQCPTSHQPALPDQPPAPATTGAPVRHLRHTQRQRSSTGQARASSSPYSQEGDPAKGMLHPSPPQAQRNARLPLQPAPMVPCFSRMQHAPQSSHSSMHSAMFTPLWWSAARFPQARVSARRPCTQHTLTVECGIHSSPRCHTRACASKARSLMCCKISTQMHCTASCHHVMQLRLRDARISFQCWGPGHVQLRRPCSCTKCSQYQAAAWSCALATREGS